MPANPLKLIFDRQSKGITGANGTANFIPDQFQSNVLDFEIQQSDPAQGFLTGAPTFIDLSAYTLRVSVGETPTGDSGGPDPLALCTDATWDAANKKWIGSIALNTVDVDEHIGSAASAQAYFEVNLVKPDLSRITIYQGTFTIKAVVDEGLSLVPTPVDTYPTTAEVNNNFLKKVMEPGQRVVIPSPNNVYALEIGCNNDGTPLFGVIQL